MSNRVSIILVIAACLLIGLPIAIDQWLQAKDIQYDKLVSNYECEDLPCKADFDGDGKLGEVGRVVSSDLSVARRSYQPESNSQPCK
jgi:hypothetical protein